MRTFDEEQDRNKQVAQQILRKTHTQEASIQDHSILLSVLLDECEI